VASRGEEYIRTSITIDRGTFRLLAEESGKRKLSRSGLIRLLIRSLANGGVRSL